MAKRGTLEHPKTKRLARAMKAPAYSALGLLEAIWQWVGRYTPTGFLTAEELEDCADTIRFDEGGEILGSMLHACGLLDEMEGGWYIHDWHDHADDSVKKVLAKRGERFANGSELRKQVQHAPQEEDAGTVREQDANDTRQPKPKPKPKPVIDSSLRSESCPADPERSDIVRSEDPSEQSSTWIDAAAGAITMHLNQVCGKRYDAKKPHKNLRARLKEFKVPERDIGLRVCRLVIEHKFAEWGKDPRMRGFLRPETLFAESHWQSYTQSAIEWDESGRPSLDAQSATRPRRRQTPEDVLALAGGAA